MDSNMTFNDVHITFIIPDSCDDETQTSAVMQEAYSVSKQNLITVNWVRECDGECVEMNKTEVIVFQEFTGELFEKAAASKSVRVLGPWCLLVCLSGSKPIPNVEWPLLNLAMENCVVVCSNLPKETKKDIRHKVRTMGGHFTPNLSTTNTHLISDTVKSEKYNIAAPMGLKIMLPSWVDDVWESSINKLVHADNEEFQKHKCPPFHNLTISATGFTNSDEINKMITENGGKYSRQLALKSTDVLICNSTSSEKYKAARKYKIDCVSIDWVLESIKKGYGIPDLSNFPVKKATSTPTKNPGEETMDPNFSIMSAIASTHNSSVRSVLQETICTQFLSPHPPPQVAKRKGLPNYAELIDNIDIKRVKRAEAFLDGCCLYLAGFTSDHHDKLVKVLNFSGALRVDTLSERITHIIVGDSSCHEVKLIRTKNILCPMVSVKWVIDSIERQQPAPEEEYLVSAGGSPGTDHGSPLIKKGLRLLKTDMSVLENEPPAPKSPEIPPQQNDKDADEDIMMQYMRKSFANTNQEDSLAAALAMNKFETKQHISVSDKTKQSVKPNDETSAPSITMSMEETTMAENVLQNLKFLIANFNAEQEEGIKYQVEQMGGTVVNKNYKSIPDYAIVPILSSALKQTVGQVVSNLWLTEVYDSKEIPELMYYHHPCLIEPCDLMNGFVIGLSGFNYAEKCFLKVVSEALGAIVQDSLARVAKEPNILASTHLISADDHGKKYDAAVKWGLPVLSREWLLECVRLQKLVPMEEYLLGASKELYLRDTSKLRNSSRLNISVNSPAKGSPVNVSKGLNNTPRAEGGVENVKTLTPLHQRVLQKESNFNTPVNNVSTYCSQITPVNQIIKNVQLDLGIKTPVTPKPWDHVDTPNTPIGAAFCQGTPPPELSKNLLRWINKFPDNQEKPRRISTPLSDLKRQLWNKVCPEYGEESGAKQPDSEAEQSMEDNLTTNRSGDSTGSEIVGEKLNQLESMLKASASSRRSSIRKLPPDLSQPYTHEVAESQPFSVGWDDNMEPSSAPKKTSLFMLSGIDVEEREEMLEQIESLGAKVSELSNYDPASTHLLCQKLNRNEKLLASMAAGKWILHTSYITDSLAAGRFLDEEEYEFGNPKSKIKVEKEFEQRATCSHAWRKEILKRGYCAFHDVRAIVVATKREPMVRVIEAGGGMVVDVSPPFDENIFATHCFLEVKTVSNIKDYIPLAQQGVHCLNTVYVNEFLHKTVRDLKDYIVPGLQKYYT